MTEDDKLAVDESRRIAQHEDVKEKFRREVNAEVASQADNLNGAEKAQVHSIGEQLKHKAVKEVAETESEIERAKGVARISQVIDYIFYLIYTFIGMEIVLELFGARNSNAFKRFIDTLTAPLLAPFNGLMPDPSVNVFRFRLSYIFAFIFYLLLHWMISGLFRLLATKKTTI